LNCAETSSFADRRVKHHVERAERRRLDPGDVDLYRREHPMTEPSNPAFRPMHEPPHPDLSIRIDGLEPADLTVTESAKALGVSRQALSKRVNGTTGISPEMALRLAKAFGSTPDMWHRLQMAYDLAQVLKREAEIIKDVHPVAMAA